MNVMQACQVMKDLNLPMDIFKEHIIGLQMSGEDQMFAEIPANTKKSFTLIYNQTNKSSIQAQKKKSSTDKNLFSGASFDPEFMEVPSDDGEDSEEEEQENEVVATGAKGATKGAIKPTAPRKPAAK